MRDIVLGRKAPEYGRWYFTHRITCRTCGTSFLLEPGDDYDWGIKTLAGRIHARHYITCHCPAKGCGMSIWHTGPIATLEEELEYASSRRTPHDRREQLNRSRDERRPGLYVKGVGREKPA